MVYVDCVCGEEFMTAWREGSDLWEVGGDWLRGLGRRTRTFPDYNEYLST